MRRTRKAVLKMPSKHADMSPQDVEYGTGCGNTANKVISIAMMTVGFACFFVGCYFTSVYQKLLEQATEGCTYFDKTGNLLAGYINTGPQLTLNDLKQAVSCASSLRNCSFAATFSCLLLGVDGYLMNHYS